MTPARSSALLLLGLLACAGTSLPDEPVLSSTVFLQRDFQLKSGLRVVVQEDPSTPLVVVTTIYGAGAGADPEGAGGLAHLLEHLTYRSRLSGTRLSDWLKGAGAIFNATTTPETIQYIAFAQRSALSDLLQIEIGRLIHPLEGISAEDVQVERQVVLNERWQWQNAGVGPDVANELLVQLFPAGHPLARPVLGTEASLAAATLPALRAFAQQHHRPENCTLVVAGNVKAGEVAALMREWPAEALAGPDPTAPPRPHRPPLAGATAQEPPGPVSVAMRSVKGAVTEPHLVLAWSLPGLSRDNSPLLSTVARVLQYLARNAAARPHVLATTSGSLVALEVPLHGSAKPEEQRDRLLRAIASEGAVTLARDATPDLRWSEQVEVIRATADPVASAARLAQHLAASGRSSLYKDTVEQLLAVDQDTISAFLRKYVTRERAVALLVTPDPDARPDQAGAGAAAGQQHLLGGGSKPNVAGMTGKEILRAVKSPRLAGLPRFGLANGLEVVVVTRPSTPIARIDLRLPGGDAAVTPRGLARLASQLSIAPCVRRHVSLRRVGGTFEIRTGATETGVSVVVPDGNLANGLASLSDHLSCREVESQDFDALGATFDRWEKDQRELHDQARVVLGTALYPGHPYAGLRDLPGLRRTTRRAANEYLAWQFRPDAALAVVTTGRSVAEVQALVAEFLADWKPSGSAAPRTSPPPPPGPTRRVVRVFDRRGHNQVQLRLGCRLPPVTAENMAAFDVLEEVLREQTGELRESWGATYGLHAQVVQLPGASHLVVEGAVETSQAAAGVSRLLAILEEDARAGPGLTTFTAARWDVARRFGSHFATDTGVVSSVLSATRLGLPALAFDTYPVRLANTARTEVRDLPQTCSGREVITLIGDARTLAPQLAARGLR